jgi:hypothetical protein
VNESVNLGDIEVEGRIKLKCFFRGAHTEEIGLQQLIPCNVKLQFHETSSLIPDIKGGNERAPSFTEETVAAGVYFLLLSCFFYFLVVSEV